MDLQKLARYKELLLNRKKTSEPAEGYDSAVRPKGQSEQGGGPEAVIGIDVGNQSGCAALFKNGNVNQLGPRFSVELQGEPAVRAVKSRIDANLRFSVDGCNYNPSGIYQMLLERLKKDLGESLDSQAYKCVLTVPLAYDANQRRLAKKAAEKAGFNVLQLINEPTAIAFYYCYNTSKNGRYLLVSAGSATFGVIAFEFASGAVRVICGSGEGNFGADDYDVCLAQSLQSDIAKPARQAPKVVLPEPMRQACEQVRLQLERQAEVSSEIVSISKQQYLQCTKRLNTRLKMHITDVLTQSKLDTSSFDAVLIAGGFAQSFLVRAVIDEALPESLKRVTLPLESAAYGAAVQAHLLSKQ